LGIAFTEPLYVLGLNKEENTVIVGIREETYQTSFLVTDLNWIAIDSLNTSIECMVKIRSAQKEREAVIEKWNENEVRVTFHAPNDAITPGQSAVFYQGDSVLGGGIIQKVLTQ
jgi:tRNA-specific 2-thiouridylase